MNNKKLNKRQQEISDIVDELLPNNSIENIFNKYSSELEHYTLIETLEEFSTLKLAGSMKYINKYDKKLRHGGLLIKIYNKNNVWFGIIKKLNGKKNYISFNSNHIFYCENIGEILNNNMKENLSYFLSTVENDYEII
jgi:hypothetical protein